MKRMLSIIGGVALATSFAVAGAALGDQKSNPAGSIRTGKQSEAGLAEMAKISMDAAVNAAMKQVPGKVLKVELEDENGYLVYGVEIAKADRQIADVKVDAGNGKVLKIDKDSTDGEDREKEDSDNGHEEVER